MTPLARLLLSASFLLAAFPSAAADPPRPPDASDIVVTGQRITPEQIRTFVDSLTRTTGGRQIGHFERSVCPAAVGLPPSYEKAVLARIRTVAKAVGLDAGGEKCTVNLLLIVTRDKAGLLRDLGREQPRIFGDMSPARFRELVDDPAPAVSWYMQGMVDADGREMPVDETGSFAINRTTRRGSRINLPARPTISAAAVVVDANVLPGLSTTQLADYVAMRSLARTDPARLPADGPPTILRILDAAPDAEVPVTLTPTDLAFLKGLYQSGTVSAARQRSEIRSEMEKSAETGEPR